MTSTPEMLEHTVATNRLNGVVRPQQSGGDDRLTIIAFSVIAGFLAAILHEGLGHGLVAYLQGAHTLLLTNCYLSSDIDTRSILAAGTLVNLGIGGVAWLLLRATGRASFSLRYFLWLTMTLNLFDGTGYFFYSGVAGFGDWQEFIKALHPYWLWRVGIAILGAATYYGVVLPLSARWLACLVAGSAPDKARLGRLTILPYLAIGFAGTIAAIPNLLGWKLIIVSAAAATFGGLFGFWFIRGSVESRLKDANTRTQVHPGFVQRNTLVIILAVVVFILNLAIFGRGLSWQNQHISLATQRSAS